MFWKILIQVVLVTVGFVLSAYGIIVPMICINFGLPATKKLDALGRITDAKRIKKRNLMTVLFWTVIDLVVIILICLFVPSDYSFALLIGAVICVLVGIGRTGANYANAGDYIAANKQFLVLNDGEDVEVILDILTKK